MKRCIALLMTLVLLCLSLPALATETAQAATLEEVQALLARYREEGVASFDITCEKDLYDTLSADRFALFFRLCYAAGISDPSFRYSASGLIKVESAKYDPIITYAEVDSLAAAEQAVSGFIAAGAKGFTLYCAEDVFSALWDNREMYSLLARLGVEDFKLSGSRSSGMCYVTSIKRFTTPWALVSDVYAAGDAIAAWHEQKAAAFTLVFDKETFDGLDAQARRVIEHLGGIDSCSASRNTYAGSISYTNVTWLNVPTAYCTTEEELVNTIRGMGASGEKAFRIILSQPLWDSVTPKSFARLQELHGQAGLSQTNLRYSSGACLLVYDSASITTDVTVLSTPAEVRAFLSAATAKEDAEISLFLTEDMYDRVMDGVTGVQLIARNAVLYDLAAQGGIFHYHLNYNREAHVVTLSDIRYFPGTQIVHALASGTEGALSPRLQQTLAAARALASECAGATPADTARRIHDRICDQVTYAEDESTDEDDCCIGALLNGKANCDGYSDAMYLVGTLAGLEMGFQHGDSQDGGLSSLFSTHIWNVIRLDGTWRMIDVTWDDNDYGADYLWFNIGADRARRTHTWNEDFGEPLAETTDTAARPVAEYAVTTEADVTAAAADACAKGLTAFDLYRTEGSALTQITAPNALQNGMTGRYYYFWVESLGCLSVTRVQ